MYRDGVNCPSQCVRCRPFAAPRRRLSHRITAVVGNSPFILDRHRSQGYFTEVDVQTVIPNPIRLPEKKSVNTSNQQALSRGGGHPLQIGFLGRLTPQKGIEHLLRVVDAMAEETVHVRVGGTGDDEYVEALKSEYASSKVTFCGYVDPDAFLPALDVLVVPSCLHESFGRVVVEAYAHGVPVIAAQRGGACRRLLTKAKRGGRTIRMTTGHSVNALRGCGAAPSASRRCARQCGRRPKTTKSLNMLNHTLRYTIVIGVS